MAAGWIGIPGLVPYSMKAAPSGAPTVPGLEFNLLINRTQFTMKPDQQHYRFLVNRYQYTIPKDK